jgi:nitrate/nitrite transporter NarK
MGLLFAQLATGGAAPRELAGELADRVGCRGELTWVWVLGGIAVVVLVIAPYLDRAPPEGDDPDWP